LHALLDTEAVSSHLADAILEPAEGNPFFVEEMLAMLVERGALERRGNGWTATERLASMSLPDSIHGVIAARIDLLHAADRDALRRCSVMGRMFWPSAVGVEDEVIAGLGRRAIVTEQVGSSFSGRREFAFKHALTHEVAYATLPRVERRALHRRVAEWIAESVPDRQAETTEVVAYHYEQALRYGDRDDELARRLFEALRAAAEAAVRRGAYTTAATLLNRALEIAPSDLERAKALLVAGRVDIATRRWDEAVERLDDVIRSAEENGDRILLGDALGWRARASWLQGSWRDAIERSEEAVAVLDGMGESAELARALARLSQIQMLRSLPEAEGTTRRAIEVACRVGDGAAEANARTNLFTVLSVDGRMPSTTELEEIVGVAVAAGAHDEAARAVVNYLWSAALLGPLEPVETVVQDAVRRLAAGFAAEGYEQYVRFSLGTLVYVPSGRWREADALLEGSTELASATVRLVWWWLVVGLALRRGDLDVADAHLPEFREVALASEEPQRIIPMASVAMPRALLAGDASAVTELADVVLAQRLHTITLSGETIPICRAIAAIEDASRLEQLLHAVGDTTADQPRTVRKAAQGLLERLEGTAGRSAVLLSEAENELRALGRHYDAACIALEVAQSLEVTGDATGAEAARARAASLHDPHRCVKPF
jgi:tetratricopeptide (TPR) repeat protein